MNSYEALSRWYDRLTQDVDYERWADWLETQLKAARRPVKQVLDLACGTGTMTALLASRGYQVVGVDQSEEMLVEASAKAAGTDGEMPLFLCQSMEELELIEPVDACVCCLDSINYMTEEAAVRETFRRVYESLLPGGRFVFDVHAPEKLRALDGEIFLDETEDLLCLWRAAYEEAEEICYYGFDLFARRGKLWERLEEQHQERAWRPEWLQQQLREAGFARVTCTAGSDVPECGVNEGRFFLTADKEA